MRVICRPLLERRLDVYSSAGVRYEGNLCASRMEVPASRGVEIRHFRSMMIGEEATITGQEIANAVKVKGLSSKTGGIL